MLGAQEGLVMNHPHPKLEQGTRIHLQPRSSALFQPHLMPGTSLGSGILFADPTKTPGAELGILLCSQTPDESQSET